MVFICNVHVDAVDTAHVGNNLGALHHFFVTVIQYLMSVSGAIDLGDMPRSGTGTVSDSTSIYFYHFSAYA